MSDVLLSIQGF